ncbi:WD40 repeat domain-containing protein [Singulisphaera rosea]
MGLFRRLFSRPEKPGSAGSLKARIWDVSTGDLKSTLAPPQGGVQTVAFSPDGKSLAGGGAYRANGADRPSGQLISWDLSTGRIRWSREGLHGGIRTVAFSPDGRYIASGGDGGVKDTAYEAKVVSEVRLWDAGTGRLCWTAEEELGEVNSLEFSPDGKSIVFCDHKSIASICVRTGILERTFKRPTLNRP